MHFPAVSSVPSKARTRSTLAAPTAGGETILLVEDEDAVRVIVAEILRRQGYHVLEAASPGAACDVFDRRASEIDLLLTDIVMPGMNGPALAQRLIGQRPDLRVLFMSGYAEVATLLDAGNPHVGFLPSPFSRRRWRTRSRTCCREPAGREPRRRWSQECDGGAHSAP
jgi:DNA-binding NtrC family response regulator